MHEHNVTRQQRLAYEKILYRYSSALQDGDLDSIIAILRTAENDPHLEQMIFEAHKEGYQQEESLMIYDNKTHQSASPSNEAAIPHRIPRKLALPARVRSSRWPGGLQKAAAVLIVAALVISMLFLFTSRHRTNVGSSQLAGNGGVTQQQEGIIVTASVVGNTQRSTGTITASNAQTGAALWHYTFGKTVDLNDNVGLAIQNHIVYMAYNKQVQAFQARDGKPLWKTTLGTAAPFAIIGDNPAQLVVDQQRVYASGYSGGNLYTLDIKTGKVLWHYNAPIAALLTVHNGVAYIMANGDDNQNAVKALKGTNGALLWQHNTTMPLSAVIANNVLYVQTSHAVTDPGASGKEQKSLTALNLATGGQFWSTIAPANAPSQLAVAQGTLIMFDGNHFCGYNTANGSHVWCTQGPANDVNGEALVSVDGIVYGAYHPSLFGNDRLEALNPKNGSVIWSKDLAKAGIKGTPLISLGDRLVLPCFEGALIFNRVNGNLLWQSSGFLVGVAAGS